MISFLFTDDHGNAITIGRASRHLNAEPKFIRNLLEDWQSKNWKNSFEKRDGPFIYAVYSPDDWNVATIKKMNRNHRVIRSQFVSMEVIV